MPEPKEKTLKSILLNPAVITTLSVAIVYIVGYFYEYGYLANFGLSSQYFPREIEKTGRIEWRCLKRKLFIFPSSDVLDA